MLFKKEKKNYPWKYCRGVHYMLALKIIHSIILSKQTYMLRASFVVSVQKWSGKLKITCSCEFIIISTNKGVMQVEEVCHQSECRHLGTEHQGAGLPRWLSPGAEDESIHGHFVGSYLCSQGDKKKKKKSLKERKFMWASHAGSSFWVSESLLSWSP